MDRKGRWDDLLWMGEPDLRRGDLLADEAKKWWLPYAAEFVGTLLFQVFGGSTAVTMDAVFNGVGAPHMHMLHATCYMPHAHATCHMHMQCTCMVRTPRRARHRSIRCAATR